MLVVADNTPLRYLILLQYTSLLPTLLGRIVIPHAVFAELTHARAPEPVRRWCAAAPSWLEVRRVTGVPEPTLAMLEQGEQEAISLAQELHADMLLVDDGAARNTARRLALPIMGTIGIFELAAARGLLDLPTALRQLQATNFRISQAVVEAALHRAEHHPRTP